MMTSKQGCTPPPEFLRCLGATAAAEEAAQITTSPSRKHKREDDARVVTISRKQFPLLVNKSSTLHGIQGKTAEPGIAAHWKLPKRLSPEARWLAHYVILSRPRNLKNIISYGVPERSILESGPPEKNIEVFERLFAEKIKKTKIACREARLELGWTP